MILMTASARVEIEDEGMRESVKTLVMKRCLFKYLQDNVVSLQILFL